MGDSTKFPFRGVGRDRVLIAGSFHPNGSTAVDNSKNKGTGFTVTRTAAGQFTITFRERFARLVSFTCQLVTGGLTFGQAIPESFSPGDDSGPAFANLLTIKQDASTAQFAAFDWAQATDRHVCFVAVFSDTANDA